MADSSEKNTDLTKSDNKRIMIVTQTANGILKPANAAEILGVTTRQVSRLLVRYKEKGPLGLIHKNRGKPPGNKTDPEVVEKVLKLYAEKYHDFGPTLLSDSLKEDHGIELSPDTLQRIMAAAGFWSPTHRPPGHRRWRERKPCLGQMIQMDASEHDWLSCDGPNIHLISMVDDATSQLYCRFYETDSTETNMDCIMRYINIRGRPLSLYTDRADHFKVNPPEKKRRKLRAS
jgi:transposase